MIILSSETIIFWRLVVPIYLGETIRNSAVLHSYDGTTQILNHARDDTRSGRSIGTSTGAVRYTKTFSNLYCLHFYVPIIYEVTLWMDSARYLKASDRTQITNILDIAGRYASHANPTVLREVNMMFFHQFVNLFCR